MSASQSNRTIFYGVIIALAALLAGPGCLTQNNAPVKLARDLCKKAQECDRSEFEEEFSSLNDCIDEVSELFEDISECYQEAGCDFQRDAVAECRRDIRSASCSDYDEEECDEFYSCTNSQEEEVFACFLDNLG